MEYVAPKVTVEARLPFALTDAELLGFMAMMQRSQAQREAIAWALLGHKP